MSTDPSITDYIQAAGVVIGVPAIIIGYFNLKKSDKEAKRKVDALENLVKHHNDVVNSLRDQTEQLTIQSSHFQYQNFLLSERNKLIEKQIEIQVTQHKESSSAEQRKADFELQKRKTSIMPFFSLANSSSMGPGSFDLRVINKGGEAKEVYIQEVNTDKVTLKIVASNVGNGERLTLSGTVKEKVNLVANDVTYEINLRFKDIDGNEYFQKIQKVRNGKYIIDEPKEG